MIYELGLAPAVRLAASGESLSDEQLADDRRRLLARDLPPPRVRLIGPAASRGIIRR